MPAPIGERKNLNPDYRSTISMHIYCQLNSLLTALIYLRVVDVVQTAFVAVAATGNCGKSI
jgi:hypothetical protein